MHSSSLADKMMSRNLIQLRFFATHAMAEVCAYDDTLAVFVGRILLTGSSVVGVAFVFLCVRNSEKDTSDGLLGEFESSKF